jgi:hypothetical protein
VLARPSVRDSGPEMARPRGRVIHLKAGHGHWTAYAKNQRNAFFFIYAREFWQAARKTGSPLVRAYLLGHALELMLKTYLLTTGFGERQIRKLKHNLSRTLAESRAAGLEQFVRVSPETENALHAFSSVYASEAFRYFSILHLLSPPSLPDFRRLMRFARTLERQMAIRVRPAAAPKPPRQPPKNEKP